MKSLFPSMGAVERMLSEEDGQDVRDLVDQSHYVNFPQVDNVTYGPDLFRKEMLEQPDVLVTPNDPRVPRPNNGYDLRTGLEYSSDTQAYNSNLRDRAGFNGYMDSPILDNGTQITGSANSYDALPFVGAEMYSFEDQTNQFSMKKTKPKQQSMHSNQETLRDGREMGVNYSSDFYDHSENGAYVVDTPRLQMEEVGTPIADIEAEGSDTIQQFNRLPIFGGGGFGFMNNRFSQAMNVTLEHEDRLSQVGTNKRRMLGDLPEAVIATGAEDYSFEDQTNQFSRVAKPTRQPNRMHSNMESLRDGREMGVNYSGDFYDHSEYGDYVIDNRRLQMEELGTPIEDIEAEGSDKVEQFNRLPIFGGGGFGFMNNRFSQAMNVALERDDRLSQVGTNKRRMLGATPSFQTSSATSFTALNTPQSLANVPKVDIDKIIRDVTAKRDILVVVLNNLMMTTNRKNPVDQSTSSAISKANVGKQADARSAMNFARGGKSQAPASADKEMNLVQGLIKSLQGILPVLEKNIQMLTSKKQALAEVQAYAQSNPNDQGATAKIDRISSEVLNLGKGAVELVDNIQVYIIEQAKVSPIIANAIQPPKPKIATDKTKFLQARTGGQVAPIKAMPTSQLIRPTSQPKQPTRVSDEMQIKSIVNRFDQFKRDILSRIQNTQSTWSAISSQDYKVIQSKVIGASPYSDGNVLKVLQQIIPSLKDKAKMILDTCKLIQDLIARTETQLTSLATSKQKAEMAQRVYSSGTERILKATIQLLDDSSKLYDTLRSDIYSSLPKIEVIPVQQTVPVVPTEALPPLPREPIPEVIATTPPNLQIPDKSFVTDQSQPPTEDEVVPEYVQQTDGEQLPIEEIASTELVPFVGGDAIAMTGDLATTTTPAKSSNTVWYVLGGVAALGAITYGVMKYKKKI